MEQAGNTSRSVMIEHNEETMCFADFVRRFRVVSSKTVHKRVYRDGWDYKEAVLTPSKREK